MSCCTPYETEKQKMAVAKSTLSFMEGMQAAKFPNYGGINRTYDQMGPAERRLAVGNAQANPALLRRLAGKSPILYSSDKGMDGYAGENHAALRKRPRLYDIN